MTSLMILLKEAENDLPTNTFPDELSGENTVLAPSKMNSSGENSIPAPSKRPRSKQKGKKPVEYKLKPFIHPTISYYSRSSNEPLIGSEDESESECESDWSTGSETSLRRWVAKYLKDEEDNVPKYDNQNLVAECFEQLSKIQGLTTRQLILAKEHLKFEGRRMRFLNLSDGAKRLLVSEFDLKESSFWWRERG